MELLDPSQAESDPPQSDDLSSVRSFFDGWTLYQRIVEEDYLHHRSVADAFGKWIGSREGEFSFLDLGCGDGSFAAGILSEKPPLFYSGIDLSHVALDLAGRNLSALGVPVELREGNFLKDLDFLSGNFDVVYTGLSLHHLMRVEKEAFFRLIRGKVAAGGSLVIYDPILNPGETRDLYMGRWVDHARWSWRALSEEDLGRAVEHVTTADHPEEITTLNRFALAAGFHAAEVLFLDRMDFYALMVFRSDDVFLQESGGLPAGSRRV